MRKYHQKGLLSGLDIEVHSIEKNQRMQGSDKETKRSRRSKVPIGRSEVDPNREGTKNEIAKLIQSEIR